MTDTRNPKQDDAEVLHRKARLRELIEHCFGSRQSALANHIAFALGKKPNQGEMSQLMKDHSGRTFGDDKARALTEAIGLHRRWFDMPLGSHLKRDEWLNESPGNPAAASALPKVRRPTVSTDALMATINSVANMAGISLSVIFPDQASARERIRIALGEPAEDQGSAGKSLLIDLSSPAEKARPITKTSETRSKPIKKQA